MLQNLISKLALLTIALLATSLAVADDKRYLLTEKTYKVLSAAQTLMAEDKHSAAETKLTTLLANTKLTAYDKAMAQQTLAYLYASQDDYKKARELFQHALDSQALPDKVSHDLRYNLAQLLLADGVYQQGIAVLTSWLTAEESPPNSAYVLLASAYYRIQQYQDTLNHINTAINADSSPQESWYQLALAAHIELQQYQQAIKVLELLITRYPYKKVYWDQLAGFYLQQDKAFRSLAVTMLAEKLALGDDKTLLNLIELYRYLQIPYKAANLLQTGIDEGVIPKNITHLTDLANSWLAAQETPKAAKVLKQLTALDNSGAAHLQYGQILVELEQWPLAASVLTESVAMLKNEQQGLACLLLGMSQFYLGNLAQAKQAFNQAAEFSKQRSQAASWLHYIGQQAKGVDYEQSPTTQAATG